jgi:LytTr DNA-binding domain
MCPDTIPADNMTSSQALAVWEGVSVEHLRERWGLPMLMVFDQVESTNDVALEEAARGAPSREHRDRKPSIERSRPYGRLWESHGGHSLLMTVIVPFETPSLELVRDKALLATARVEETCWFRCSAKVTERRHLAAQAQTRWAPCRVLLRWSPRCRDWRERESGPVRLFRGASRNRGFSTAARFGVQPAGCRRIHRPATAAAAIRTTACRSERGLSILAVSDIDWIGATGDYVTLHVGTKEHLVRRTISSLERELDPDMFLRVHRSTIVQASRICELVTLQNGEFLVRLRDGTELKSSRSYSERLEQWL